MRYLLEWRDNTETIILSKSWTLNSILHSLYIITSFFSSKPIAAMQLSLVQQLLQNYDLCYYESQICFEITRCLHQTACLFVGI